MLRRARADYPSPFSLGDKRGREYDPPILVRGVVLNSLLLLPSLLPHTRSYRCLVVMSRVCPVVAVVVVCCRLVVCCCRLVGLFVVFLIL